MISEMQKANESYPMLMICKTDNTIVLMSSKGTGTVVCGDNLGSHSCVWNMAKFEPFSGRVILSN